MTQAIGGILGALKEIGLSYLPWLGAEEEIMREEAQYHIISMGVSNGDNPPEDYLSKVGHSQKAYDIWREECYKHNNR